MIDAPFALAFAAGMVASVNPCGFAMLPAYLSVLVGTGGQGASRPAAVARVLRVGLIVAGGFLVVFGMAGVGLTAGARWITTAVPWAALGVGLLAVVGLSLVAGRSLPLRLPSPARAPTGGGTAATALFGISYAVASLSCTLPGRPRRRGHPGQPRGGRRHVRRVRRGHGAAAGRRGRGPGRGQRRVGASRP